MRCPKSVITAWSLEMLDRFRYWKACGGGPLFQEQAKAADALFFLNEQWLEEQRNVED